MKKILCIVLSAIISITTVSSVKTKSVCAATLSEDRGFEIDESMFWVQWYESDYIQVYQTCGSVGPLKKNDKIGRAKITIGVATSKYVIDNKRYQKILVKAEMLPNHVRGDNYGMAQYLEVQVSVYDDFKNLYIEPKSSQGKTTYSTSGTVGIGFNGGVSKTGKKYTLDGGADFSLQANSSCEYAIGSLIVDTNKDAGGFAEWNYDYVSSNNKEQNAYLFGSSEQYGVLSWNTSDKLPVTKCINVSISATFGGGNKKSNKRYQKVGYGKYHLGSYKKEYNNIIYLYNPGYYSPIILKGRK